MLAAGFQQSLNTHSVLQVQSGSKLNANKCRLKKVFKKKLAPTIILPQNNQFPIRTERSSLFIMDFGVCTSSASIFSVSLCRYVKLSFSDTPQHCSPPTKTGVRQKPHVPALPTNPGSSVPSVPVPVPSRLSPFLQTVFWVRALARLEFFRHPPSTGLLHMCRLEGNLSVLLRKE